MADYGLGRRPYMSEKSHRYNIAPLLALPARYRRDSEPWPRNRILDQGASGTCTAAMLRGLYESRPVPHGEKVGPDWIALYRKIVLRDTFPDNDREADPALAPRLEDLVSGSSVDAALMTGVDLGWWKEVRWCRSLADADDWIRRRDGSPLGIGINWYSGFFDPDHEGIVRPTGSIEGGHAIRVRYHFRRRGLWLLTNSWGPDWGVGGECFMDDETFDRVCFKEAGECGVAVEMIVAPIAPG